MANWTMYPIWNYFCLHSFLLHGLQIAFVMMILAGGDLRPRVRNLWRVVVFLVILVPVIYYVNIKLGTNFLFINAGAENTPLAFFINLYGSPGFLVPYAGMLILLWVFMYLPWELAGRRKT